MKSILLFCFLALTFFSLNAQNTLIPDSNFEQALIDLGHDNVLDGQVLTTNISALIELDVSFKNISDLTGIEDFSAMENLNCVANSIAIIDLSNNLALDFFDGSANQFATIDLSNNTNLTELYLSQNQLTGLDLSSNTSLTKLVVLSNMLTSLDLSNNVLLNLINLGGNSISSIDLSSNTALSELKLTSNSIFSIDISNNSGLVDLDLRGNDLTTLDLSANLLLEELDIYSNQISAINLTNNVALKGINFGINPISTIDLSNQIALTTLSFTNTQITNIDLSQNLALSFLLFSSNAIPTIDLETNVNLGVIVANNNDLVNIDLSNNSMLWRVNLNNNNLLESINIKNGNNSIITQFNATNNPLLNCVQVDNAVDANLGVGVYSSWIVTPNIIYEEHCLDTFVPDDNFEQALIDLGFDSGTLDDYVPTENISSIISLDIDGLNISDLTGIEDFLALKDLRIRDNNLVSLNLSNNSNLTDLRADNNNLSSLNLKSGNNAILTFMRAENNNLACVDVDDEIAANAGTGSYSSWRVDNGVTYSENCGGCPEMDVLGNSVSIFSGDDTPDVSDDTDFGIVIFGEFLDMMFTIENTGTEDLNLIGSPIIQITNSVDFIMITPPSVLISANGGSTMFTIRYTPSMAGTINTATITIANDECD